MIDQYGIEKFTFKKLAKEIHSTEASIYRYFGNKHKLLLYLVKWYWEWVYYLIKNNTMNIKDPQEKVRIIIHSIVAASDKKPTVEYINENILHSIVISEGVKSFRSKWVGG